MQAVFLEDKGTVLLSYPFLIYYPLSLRPRKVSSSDQQLAC